MASRSKSFGWGALIVVLAVFSLGSLALATEITRAEYKERVEPICQTDTKANEKILAGVRAEVTQGKLKLAGSKLLKAASALGQAYRELQAEPQPPADEARLTKWLSYVKTEATLFEKAGRALKAGNKNKAQSYVIKLTRNANLANSTVVGFGFHYCKLEPSKFT